MRNMWDKTMELFAKVNEWIPLDAIFWAGVGVVALVLILGIVGCAVRKRLIPQWLIWIYFTFAVIVLWAYPEVTINNVMLYLEYPLCVVLLCYILRLIFYRAPRYVFVKAEVYERYVAKRAGKTVTKTETAVVEKPVKTKAKKEKAVETETETVTEIETKAEKATATETSTDHDADEKIYEATIVEEVKTVKTEPVKVEPAAETTTTVIDLPEVQPIPQKTYEPVREPDVITTPIMQNLPNVSARTTTTTTTVRPASANTVRTVGTGIVTTSRNVPNPAPITPAPRTTTTISSPISRVTTTTTTTTTRPTTTNLNSSYTSRVTSTNTTTTTATRSAATGTTTNTSSSQSTQDIMSAIARLRASMNNKK